MMQASLQGDTHRVMNSPLAITFVWIVQRTAQILRQWRRTRAADRPPYQPLSANDQ